MQASMTPDGIIEVILSDEEQDAWQTNIPDLHDDIQQQALRSTLDRGLRGDIHLLFATGACVCTIRLVHSWLTHVEDEA